MSMLATLLRQVFVRTGSGSAKETFDAGMVFNEAVECLRSGRDDHALALCARVLEREPRHARALHLAGTIQAQRGELAAAGQSLNRALALDPGCADAWADLGNVKRLEGGREEALACYTRALEIDSGHVVAALGRCQLLAQSGRESEAIEAMRARIAPGYEPLLLRELVRLLCRQNQFDEARLLCRQALSHDPNHAEAHASAGYLALVADQDPVLALRHFDQAALALPEDADLSSNRGIALQQLGRFEEAIACYDHSIGIDPRHRAGRIHRALARLLAGDYPRGWEEYEYRRFADDWAVPPMGVAEWQGEELRDKSIYVYAEQGIGDEILFASCLPDLLAQSRRVLLECDPRLMTLFARSFPGITVFSRARRLSGAYNPSAAGADFMVPIGSLPRYFRTHGQSFATRDGYLRADERLAASMRARLAALPGKLRIGISWRGGTAQTDAASRSMRCEDLHPLLQTAGVSWVSVQYGDTRAEISELSARGIRMDAYPEVLADYEQTAALTCALDLVISVDTAIVNLCGALGRRTWAALPVNPHWRYGLRAQTMPWYASVRLARQAVRGDWTSVIADMKERLRAFDQGSDNSFPFAAD